MCKILADYVSPTLTSLGMRGIRLTQRSIHHLLPLARNLKEMDFTMTFQAVTSPQRSLFQRIVETRLAELISECNMLEILSIGENVGLVGDKLFPALPASLRKLRLSASRT